MMFPAVPRITTAIAVKIALPVLVAGAWWSGLDAAFTGALFAALGFVYWWQALTTSGVLALLCGGCAELERRRQGQPPLPPLPSVVGTVVPAA